ASRPRPRSRAASVRARCSAVWDDAAVASSSRSFRSFPLFVAGEDIPLARDLVDDEAGGDRQAIIVQHRKQARRIDGAFIDEERAQLRVPILLDDEDLIMLRDEIDYLLCEGETAH